MLVGLLIGIVIGAALGYLFARGRLAAATGDLSGRALYERIAGLGGHVDRIAPAPVEETPRALSAPELVGAAEPGPAEVSPAGFGAAEIASAELNPDEISPAEADLVRAAR